MRGTLDLARTVIIAAALCVALAAPPAMAGTAGRTPTVSAEDWPARYFDALADYGQGRYAEAKAAFSRVEKGAENEFLRLRAALGVFWSDMAGAATVSEYAAAKVRFENWVDSQGGGPLPIDPELLAPFLDASGPVFARQKGSGDALRAELCAMAEEVERLRRQISDLESLYREIRNKEKIIE